METERGRERASKSESEKERWERRERREGREGARDSFFTGQHVNRSEGQYVS